MKTPICDICLKSDILCPACIDKIERGIISNDDIGSLKKIKSASARIKPLQGIMIKRIFNTRGFMVLVCEKGNATRIIGRGGTIIKNLTKAIGKRVRVIEETDDPKILLEMLVYPLPVLSVGKVYRESGEATRIRVPEGGKLQMPIESIREIFMKLFGQELEVLREQ